MNNIFKSFFLLFIPMLALVATGCVEEDEYVDLHPRLAEISPIRGRVGTEIMVKGRNLANVTSVMLGDVEVPIARQTADSIYVTVPANAEVGSQQLRITSPEGVSVMNFEVQGALAMPRELIFNDALSANWQIWGGWGGVTYDVNNNTDLLDGAGAKNLKITFADAYGGFQTHPLAVNPANFSRVMISIKPSEASVGNSFLLYIKNADGTELTKKKLVLTEGYNTFSIPFAELGNPGSIAELNIQNEQAGSVIYVDAFGLD